MKTIFTIIFCLLTGIALCQSPAYAWSARIGADSTDSPLDIATDAAGNVYTTGFCDGIVDFDPGPGTYTLGPASGAVNPGASDIYITKMDASGNLIWARRFGSTTQFPLLAFGMSISVDASGNVVTTGNCNGTVDFDPGPGVYNLSIANYGGIYILKLDANGNFVWAKGLTGWYGGQTSSAILDPFGNLYVTGIFNGTIDMDPGPGTFNLSGAFSSSFILKLDPLGNFIFAKLLSSAGNSIPGVTAWGMTLDVSGNVYTTGSFVGACDFDPGPGTYTLTSTNSFFVLKLDAAGNFVWARQFANVGNWNSDLRNQGIITGGNYLYITGTFLGIADFDPGPGSYTLMPTGLGVFLFYPPEDQFILKLDLAGNFVWARSVSSTKVSTGIGIALDAVSGIYAVGTFEGITDFDPGPGIFNVASNGGTDGFIVKLDASGNFVWAETIGGVSSDWLKAISITANAEIYLTGSFEAAADFDPGNGVANLMSVGKEDIFIAKWSQCSAAAPPVDLTPSQNKIICENTAGSLFAYAVNPVGWYASATSTLSLGTGTNYITVPLALGDYTFYAADPICNNFSRTAVTLTVDACTGLRSLTPVESIFLNVFPVPSNDGLIRLRVSSVNMEMNFEVYNTLGELIIEQKLLNELTELDLSEHPSGVYFVQLKSQNKQLANQKIIKQ